MTRVLLDANVHLSALLSPTGPPAEIVTRWRSGEFDLVVSPMLLQELTTAVEHRRLRSRLDVAQVHAYVTTLASDALLVDDPRTTERVSPDPRDDYLLALARMSGAEVIVSGDRHLTELGDVRPPVLTPREFLDRLSRNG